MVKTDEETLNRWTEHFNDILTVPSPDEEVYIPPSENTLDILVDPSLMNNLNFLSHAKMSY